MLRALNKLSGAVAGAVLYPVKSALINAGFIILTSLAAALIIILLPIYVGIEAYRIHEENKLGNAIFAALMIGLLTFTIGIPATIIAVFVELALACTDLVDKFLSGIIEGAAEGLFFHVISRTVNVFDFTSFSLLIQVAILGFALKPMPEPTEADIFDKLIVKPQEENNFLPLSEADLKKAEKISELKSVVEKYVDLNERLNNLDNAIAKREYGEQPLDDNLVRDELVVYMEIKDPILVVKLVNNAPQGSPEQWEIASGSTKISDKAVLRKWLVENNDSHPLDRTSMVNPPPGLKYIIIPYRNKSNAQELMVATSLIRLELVKATPAEKIGRPIVPTEGVISGLFCKMKHMMFGDMSRNTREVEQDLGNSLTP